MGNRFFIFLLLVVLGACSREGIVQSVEDGGHIIVGDKKVQLLGVEAPKLGWSHIAREEECYAKESKKFLESLIMNETVTVTLDAQGTPIEQQNPVIAYVYFGDALINASLIKNGYARLDHNASFLKFSEFARLETEAKKLKLGLWGACR